MIEIKLRSREDSCDLVTGRVPTEKTQIKTKNKKFL
jgi:hypothetical protein